MAKINRYDGNLLPFAKNFTGGNRTIFGETTQSDDLTDNINTKFLQGWEATTDANTFPTKQDFNAVGYVSTALASYLHQVGIPEWNGSQEYHENSFVNYNGVLYRCKTNNHTSVTNPASDSVNWEDVLGNFVAKTGNETIAGVKTFTSSPIVPTPTADFQVATKEYVDNNIVNELVWVKPPSRRGKSLFTKVNPHSISIPAGFKVAVNNKVISLTADYILSLNSDLDTGIKTAGKDYYVYAKDNGTFYISANGSITIDKLIGGFHYGLTGETEALPANALKTEADMAANRGIKAYSFWDLTWKPASPRPEGKVLVNNLFWRDIYPADEDYAIRGYSSCFALDGITPAKIAGGEEINGRKFPKIPLSKGGDGTLNYGSLTWFEANEIISEVGMRMISYDEFSNSSYGVVEEKSLSQLGYTIKTGVIQHYPELESKWGVEMAVGVQYYWSGQILNGHGTTDLAHRTGLTDGRGSLFSTSNSPVSARLGGYELGTSTDNVSGSRNLNLDNHVWNTTWISGFVAVCNHINLDR